MGLRPIQADEKRPALRSEPRPSGSGNAKHRAIESGTLIGFRPRLVFQRSGNAKDRATESGMLIEYPRCSPRLVCQRSGTRSPTEWILIEATLYWRLRPSIRG